MSKSNPFKWRHHQAQIILRCVRWYLTYPPSYRQVAEMVNERGMDVHHTTVFRWVQEYGPEIDKRCRPYLNPTNNSWRVDETYIEVKGKPKYLYRAVDSDGNTLDFLLTAKRDAEAAKRSFGEGGLCFKTRLGSALVSSPRFIGNSQSEAGGLMSVTAPRAGVLH